MKKLLSVILAIIMTLSVFSCVSVYAVEDVTVPETGETTQPETQPTYATAISEVTAKVEGVYVKWSCDGEADKYNVYRRAAGEAEPTLIATVTSLDYTDKTVKNAVYYKYHVEAVVDDEVKVTSEGVLTRFFETPKNVKAVVKTTWDGSYDKIVLTWTKVEGATGYAIYERKAGETEYRRYVYTGDVNTCEIHDTNIGYYRYAVVAVNGKYESALDTNGPVTKYFPSVTHIYDVNIQNGISFKWNQVFEATGYRIYRRAGGEKYWTYLGTVGQYETKYQDKTVTNNKYYKYIVRATFGTVYGPYRENTPLIHYVTAPKLLAVANATDGIYIKWQIIPGLTDYSVYRRAAGSNSYNYLNVSYDRNSNRIKDTSTIPGQYYRYVVAVRSKTGHISCYSNSLVIQHMPLGSNWNKETVLKYYDHAVYVTNRDYTQFGVTHWQNLDSHKATGNNATLARDFKNAMSSIYIPRNDPLKGYLVRSIEEDNWYWEPRNMEDRNMVKSATIQRGSTYDTITIVLNDITVARGGTTNNFARVTANYIDFGDFVQELKNQDIVYSGKHSSIYKNFTIVMKVDKNGRFISGTESCQNVTANLDLEFYNGFEVEYDTQFDTYLTYDYFKY